ncbi:MAG: hypothetical protein HUJ94_01285 [Bacteroidales bacterium]|nr:hypothetical protein [Bacteroidales bacterium]
MDRKPSTKLVSLLLTVWYLLSVAGFNLHECRHGDDALYLSTPFRTECSEIHPSSPCGGHHCYHDHNEAEESGESLGSGCCSNAALALHVAGMEDGDDAAVHVECHSVHSFIIPAAHVERPFSQAPQYHHHLKCRAALSRLSVWRI